MIREILPSLYCIEVPLPNNPLKATNSFVLTSDDRNLVIDTGFLREECMSAMTAGLDEIGVDLDRTDFFVTHLHADHFGLVPSLIRPGAKAYMSRLDAAPMRRGSGFLTMNEYAGLAGFPEELLEAALQNHPGFKHGPRTQIDLTQFGNGDTVTVGDYTLTGVETPGHTNGHICLYDRDKKMFIAGDHILGDITPNIQLWSDEGNTLGDYIDSLNKVSELEIDLCLPGHRSLIEDAAGRIRELKVHHRDRCNEVLDILEKGPQHAYRVASQMTWDIEAKSWEDFPLMQKWFATGEAIAHLKFIEEKGYIRKEAAVNGKIAYSLDSDSRLKTVD